MAAVGEKCSENEYRPECAFITQAGGHPVCSSPGSCHKLNEAEIQERLDYINRMVHSSAHKKSFTVSADSLYFLLMVIDGLKARNRKLEARVFNGFDINGRTNFAGLRSDIQEAMDNNESTYGCNCELLGLIRKWQI
jgi:hypothetical protein